MSTTIAHMGYPATLRGCAMVVSAREKAVRQHPYTRQQSFTYSVRDILDRQRYVIVIVRTPLVIGRSSFVGGPSSGGQSSIVGGHVYMERFSGSNTQHCLGRRSEQGRHAGSERIDGKPARPRRVGDRGCGGWRVRRRGSVPHGIGRARCRRGSGRTRHGGDAGGRYAVQLLRARRAPGLSGAAAAVRRRRHQRRRRPFVCRDRHR